MACSRHYVVLCSYTGTKGNPL
uniref:Uncharacterized protein n=1 Tax=Anguilla anguilla TaxID=7936 RepID=A0A0E9VBE2_ANGAN